MMSCHSTAALPTNRYARIVPDQPWLAPMMLSVGFSDNLGDRKDSTCFAYQRGARPNQKEISACSKFASKMKKEQRCVINVIAQ